jgi:hypothetical protein
MKEFLWIPGQGMDAAALERMRTNFKRPEAPMGEAWFMSDKRRMYDELLGDIDALSPDELQRPLADITTGLSCFGPLKEWTDWYHFLLVKLLPRSHEHFVSYLLEDLVGGFMANYPNGVYRPPYREFCDDALLTLGRCMMDRQCWNGSEIAIGEVLHRSNDNPNRVWCWWDASGDLSASMFFCLKYLPEPLMEGWLKSVLAIPSPHWRAQILVWMVGAHDVLSGTVKWPSEFSAGARPDVSWEWSHSLRPELAATDASGAPPLDAFLRPYARLKALEVVHAHFDEDTYLEWLSGICAVSYLESELAEIPDRFVDLYVRRH